MKKTLSLLLVFCLIFTLSIPAFAAETNTPISKTYPAKEFIITEEYINQFGRHSTDEFGNDIIEVPLCPSQAKVIEKHDYKIPEDTGMGVHEGHAIPDGIDSPKHFSLTPHSHEVVNLSSYIYSGYIPVTAYAAPGFTVTKSYSETAELNASLSLSGGITKGIVEGQLGVSVGGTYSCGQGESYSAVVPSGYRGRIAYRYYSYMYTFDNKTTYIWSSLPLVTTTEYDACYAQGAPYDGYFYLQLLAI